MSRLMAARISVNTAIEQCRSAPPGGHVLRYSGCAQVEVAYNSRLIVGRTATVRGGFAPLSGKIAGDASPSVLWAGGLRCCSKMSSVLVSKLERCLLCNRAFESRYIRIDQQLNEELVDLHARQRNFAFLKEAQYLVLRGRIQRREDLAMLLAAPRVELGDCHAVHLARRILHLIAEREIRVGVERPLEIPARTVSVVGFHLAIHKLDDVQVQCAASIVIGRNEPVHRRVDECSLVCGEVGRLIGRGSQCFGCRRLGNRRREHRLQ